MPESTPGTSYQSTRPLKTHSSLPLSTNTAFTEHPCPSRPQSPISTSAASSTPTTVMLKSGSSKSPVDRPRRRLLPLKRGSARLKKSRTASARLQLLKSRRCFHTVVNSYIVTLRSHPRRLSNRCIVLV